MATWDQASHAERYPLYGQGTSDEEEANDPPVSSGGWSTVSSRYGTMEEDKQEQEQERVKDGEVDEVCP